MSAHAPQRRSLPHGVPSWVKGGATHFVTICCSPRGTNQLCQPQARDVIFESASFRQSRGDWHLGLLVLMPDHLHALVAVPGDTTLAKTITDWKSLLARTTGIRWQRDFFEHRLRAEENLDQKADYMRENPVRAGLATRAEEWVFTWEPDRGGPGRSALPAENAPC